MEYELLYYIILWAANKISEEALLFYNSYLPSLEIIEKFITTNVKEWDINFLSNTEESHAKYRSTMLLMTSSLLNYVDLEQIHPSIISDIIEPLDGIWDGRARGTKMCFDNNGPYIAFTSSSSHEWIRTTLPIIGQENDFDVNYDSWLGKQAYGWVLGSNGVLCHNTQKDNGPYTNQYGNEFFENARITVHLDMNERTCSFSIDGQRYPVAFSNLPDEIYPAVSLKSPGKARIEPFRSSAR
ncbi:7185_t:CDS:2 [Funneliformis geosporum]|nr:7185_t:CDS:2 [Funneliformis geosporum]